MKTLKLHNPAAVCVYFLCVGIPLMFGVNPVTAGIALATGMAQWVLLDESRSVKGIAFYAAIPLVSALINPLFNHNGVTVLFFMNSNPVTWESVLYGLVMGTVISAAMLWARCLSVIMDTDRLLYVTGRFSPRISLALSMALRQIPMLRGQSERMREARKASGLLREKNAPDQIRSGMLIFSGLTTWALENGVITADSMTARGFGTGRRTGYSLFPWKTGDTMLITISAALFAGVAAARAAGFTGYVWYPELTVPGASVEGTAAYAAYALLCVLGIIMEIRDRIRWKRLEAGIRN